MNALYKNVCHIVFNVSLSLIFKINVQSLTVIHELCQHDVFCGFIKLSQLTKTREVQFAEINRHNQDFKGHFRS